MSKTARLLTALAALLLLGLFIWPAWRISLEAPQYPEGIGMYIRINTIEGATEFDLTKINNLNHYIGMRAIVPESIPELRYMPWIVAALIASGLAVAALGRPKALYAWLIAFALLGAAGLADFYRWSYDYGHNLDADTAIITVPGMSYQPPLIGEKQLLNFRAASWPALGGILAGVAFAVGAGAAVMSLRARRRMRAGVAGLALAAVGCASSGGPHAMRYDGTHSCDFCRMAITDRQFGTQLVTASGRVYRFDSIECLVSFQARLPQSGDAPVMWVTDFEHPETMVAATDARFARARGSRGSPMGMGLMAFAGAGHPDDRADRTGGTPDGSDAELRERFGEALRWSDVVAIVAGRESVASEADAPQSPDAVTSVPARRTITVSPDGPVTTLTAALALAAPGARIVVKPGTYREPRIVVEKPVEIVGDGWPVLDGQGTHEIMTVGAPNVTVRGLAFRNVGTSYMEDRAALRVVGVGDCTIEDNRIDDAFFGIYLAGVERCVVRRNTLRAEKGTEAASGNGIHLWSSREVTIEDNAITGHRDGIYLEFARETVVRRNTSEGNLRYGLHFMYADDCRYIDNVFRRNLAGVAVMYTKRIVMTGNRFEDNWGAASYGLLLKEISDPTIERNVFSGNTVGLLADGAARIVATDNDFIDNGWAVKLMASSYDGRFERNDFVGNSFDVVSNSGETSNRFSGNHFDAYRGYDLDRDGVGDVPHRPVRLYSVLVERNPPAMILLRSVFPDVLDMAERVLPALTPRALVDERPSLARHP